MCLVDRVNKLGYCRASLDLKVDKAYLDGRYGGVPTFTNYLA